MNPRVVAHQIVRFKVVCRRLSRFLRRMIRELHDDGLKAAVALDEQRERLASAGCQLDEFRVVGKILTGCLIDSVAKL